MPRAEQQDLTAVLKMQDQLSGPLAAAKGNLTATETTLGRLDATARKTGTSLGGLGASFGSIAKAGVVAFGAFQAIDFASDFLSGAIKGAQEEEVGIARLTAALKANVPAWDENRDAIEKTIAAREAFGFSDDALRSSLGSLVAATHNVNEALDIQNTAMDLARFKGVSLEEATKALVTIEAGRFRGLAQLGIVLREGATQEEALAAVQKVAAGQAEELGNTTAGAMEAASVAVQDLQEDIGTGLAPVIKDFATFVRVDAIPALRDFGGVIHDILQPIIDLETFLHSIGLGVPDLLGGAAGNVDEVKRAAEAALVAAKQSEGARRSEAVAVAELNRAESELRSQVASATISEEEYRQKSEALAVAFQTLVLSTEGFKRSASDSGRASLIAAEQADRLRDAAAGVGTETADTIAKVDELAGTFIRLGSTADPGIVTAVAAARDGVGLLADGIAAVGVQAEAAIIQIDAFNRAAAGARETGPTGKVDVGRDDGSIGFRHGLPVDTKVDLGLKDTEIERTSVATDHLRQSTDRLNDAMKAEQRTADTLFDALDDRIRKAIDRTLKLAQTEHDRAVQAISDNLKVEESANAAPANAAEAALRERQDEQRRRDLVEAQQAASVALRGNTDPARQADLERSLRAATESLQNFDAQAAIDRLRAVQQGLDAISEQKAQDQTAAADKELAAAKDRAQKDADAETIANAKRRDDFERALEKLRDADEKAGKSPAQFKEDEAKLEKRFGIFTDPVTGFRHIADPIVTAISSLKIEPAITVINDQSFILKIGPTELRLLASALETGNQPASTSSVRTGANGRN